MSQQHDISETLLVKYFAGEADPEEAVAISDWRDADPENDRLFRQYLQLWSQARPQGAYIPPNTEQEWQRRSRPLRWLPLAALLLLIPAAGLLWLFQRRQPAMLVITATKTLLHDTLPDHSTVVLVPGSQLKHPASFDNGTRTVELQGEAYFSVQPDAGKIFTVHTPLVNIRVLGTAFNVYNSKDSTKVQVENGAVLVYAGSDSVKLTAGMQTVYRNGRFLTGEITGDNDYAYATNVFRFKNARLDNVVAVLEKAYNVKIVLENPKLANCTISTAFKDMPLKYVLEVVAASLSIQYRIEGATIYLQGNECN